MCDSDISVVVCTRNNARNIKKVLQAIMNENPLEVIVVDGNSTDGTRAILDSLQVRVITDPGKGLAYARKMALEIVGGKYTLFVGDDNYLTKGSINRLETYIESHNWCGGACQTRIFNPGKNYWSFCSNIRWKLRFQEGEKGVIGTPYMYETELLKKASFDEECGDADDADMEYRLAQLTSKKFGYTNVKCFEIGRNNYETIKERFLRYGKSDYEYWNKYSRGWNGYRKIQSVLHPIKDELIFGIYNIHPFSMKVFLFPFLAMITLLRYIGWIRMYYKKKMKDLRGRLWN